MGTSRPAHAEIESDAIAKAAVAEAAPEELALFDVTAAAYRARRGGSKQDADELLGFGLAEAVDSLATIAAMAGSKAALLKLAEATGRAAGEAAAEKAKGLGARLLRRKAQEPVSVALPSGAPLSPEQLSEVRDAALAEVSSFGLSEERSALLANAIVGALVLRSAGGAAATA